LLREDPVIALLNDVIVRPEFGQAAQSLGGYDLGETGTVRYV
jgi:hypothetical protein